MKYRITRDPLALEVANYPQYFHPIVRPVKNTVILEAGGFDGETSIQVAKCLDNNCKIFSFEPDPNNLRIMKDNLLRSSSHSVEPVSVGLWNKVGRISFLSDGSASIVSKTAQNSIPVTTVDSFVKEKNMRVDLIKLDVEGSEREVIEGAKDSIAFFQPQLQISVYHKATDLWSILLEINRLNPYYKFYLGHHTDFITETVLYAKI